MTDARTTTSQPKRTFGVLTWNIENIKTHKYSLQHLLLANMPDLVLLSEPQSYQTDIRQALEGVSHEYDFWLNSDDLHDPELPLVKTRAIGGTMVLWRKWMEPYISVYPVQSSAFLPLVLKLPDTRISVHVALYLPTHGRDTDFISELASLQNCIEDICNKHKDAVVFIRGDSNCNPKNTNRMQLLAHFIEEFSLTQVPVHHPTYHHFVGDGKYDSNIDILLHTKLDKVSEVVTNIMCIKDNPEISSHHDLIFSVFSLPVQEPESMSSNCVVAPRTSLTRRKIMWTDTGIAEYQRLIGAQLSDLRQVWQNPNSLACTSILMQSTNSLLSLAANTTNPSVQLGQRRSARVAKTPKTVIAAQRKLQAKYRWWLRRPTPRAREQLLEAKKKYRQTVRNDRIHQAVKRDAKLDSILSKNPKDIYSYLRSIRRTNISSIQTLSVGDRVYEGSAVADGFYDSMTALKTCDMGMLSADPDLAEHFTNYEHILKICEADQNIPEISVKTAEKLLRKMKTHVIDIYSITSLHYLYAGQEGIQHFTALINILIKNVNNATLEEVNTALGVILFKGHRKPKNCDRSYRTISTCPFIAKSLDLYIRDLYKDLWSEVTADTQYLDSGSSHELASLLVTEVIQYSLNVNNKPVYLLILDAQSAYDRCLRQILCTELFMTGMNGTALLLLDNRLKSRATVYQWEEQMLGPATDVTGFEQGGVNSGDFYKLYNNEQLKSAQSSALGVNIGSSTISAIGQADDVILAADSLDSLRYLAGLTERYCSNYRVKLVAAKTKLLPVFKPRHEYLVEYSKLVNSVKIEGTTVQFVTKADHVGVVRSCQGNMPNILERIACHKRALGSVTPAGMARSHRGNPSASLKIHQLYATPVLLNGLGSLYLSEPELKILDSHYKNTVQNLQRFHQNTPRAVVFLFAGCLPGRALVHSRQLSLLLMLCHLPTDPLNRHARHILTSAAPSAKSWFQQVRDLCSLYDLPEPLILLDNPPNKKQFKARAKENIASYWHQVLAAEAKKLKSLKYFKPELYSLVKPHYMWSCAASNVFECSKSTALAIMASGRFRSDMLTRHWSQNRSGFCRFPTCTQVQGTLEHMLVTCPALNSTRESMYQMWLERSVMFPSLHSTIRAVLESEPADIVQFLLEPLALSSVLEDAMTYGNNFIQQLSYMTRTFAFYMQRHYRQLKEQHDSDPPYKHVIKHSVSGPDASSSDHPTTQCTQYGPGGHASGDDWPSPHHGLASSNAGRLQGERDSHHPSLASAMLCSPYISNSRPGNTGWVSSQTRVASTQHSCNYRAKLNSKDSVSISGPRPPLHDRQHDRKPGCGGVGIASLVSTAELQSVGNHGWHAEGACRGGGGCDRVRSQAGSNVPGSCIASQNLVLSTGVPIAS